MNNESKSPSSEAYSDKAMSLPADNESIDYIKQYIEASAKSADRVRFVLFIMVTASVLTYVAVWNARSTSWSTSRLVVASDAQKFYNKDSGQLIPLSDDNAVREAVWSKFFSQDKFDHLESQDKKAEYLKNSEQAYQSAKLFIDRSRHRFADLEHLKKHVEYLERTRVEKVLNVNVPFFGIVFDINDLGIFAGITFVIILLLFRFSLLRELRNLRLVFVKTRTLEHLRLSYDILAMQQVLTTPLEIDQSLTKRKLKNFSWWRETFWNFVTKGLYLLPFLVQLRIFLHDIDTYENVKDVFPGTWNGLFLSGTLLVMNALLTVLCLYLGWKVDKRWRRHALWILKNTDRTQSEDAVGDNRDDVLNKPKYEQQKNKEQRATTESKRRYIVALLFASIFIASTTALFIIYKSFTTGDVSRLPLSSDVTIWITVFTAIVSAIGTFSTIILGWRTDRREEREKALKAAQSERDLEPSSEKPALPISEDKENRE
jgi:hypothetical protein